jgi:ribulose-phosphate 3-epimerase
MTYICPTVTAFDEAEYKVQIERLQPFAERIHIDLMDGEFAPTRSPGLEKVWWPSGIVADIHLMYQRPSEQLALLKKLRPSLVVIHIEADVGHANFAGELRQAGIKSGLAILHDTQVERALDIIESFDHVLIFSGKLGYHGGVADLADLEKVLRIREKYPDIEIGWDGGISDQNASQLAESGVGVLNVGGFVQKAENPEVAYAKLKEIARGGHAETSD